MSSWHMAGVKLLNAKIVINVKMLKLYCGYESAILKSQKYYWTGHLKLV